MRDKLRKFIADNFSFGREEAALSDDDSLLEKGFIDSTGVLELVAFLEKTYRIEVKDEELVPENLDSINQMVRFVTKKVAERGR